MCSCFIFSFVFSNAKSCTTNNHQNETSDVSYESFFGRNLNDLLNFEITISVSRKVSLKFLIFGLTLSKKKQSGLQ